MTDTCCLDCVTKPCPVTPFNCRDNKPFDWCVRGGGVKSECYGTCPSFTKVTSKMSEEDVIKKVREAIKKYGKNAVDELIIEALEEYDKRIEKVIYTLAGLERRIKKLEEWREVH